MLLHMAWPSAFWTQYDFAVAEPHNFASQKIQAWCKYAEAVPANPGSSPNDSG